MAKWIVNLCLNGWIVLLRGFLRGVLLFMFYKKFAAVVLSAVLVGVVPSVVFADVDGVSAVSDGDVEELSIEDDFLDGADSISAFASAPIPLLSNSGVKLPLAAYSAADMPAGPAPIIIIFSILSPEFPIAL